MQAEKPMCIQKFHSIAKNLCTHKGSLIPLLVQKQATKSSTLGPWGHAYRLSGGSVYPSKFAQITEWHRLLQSHSHCSEAAWEVALSGSGSFQQSAAVLLAPSLNMPLLNTAKLLNWFSNPYLAHLPAICTALAALLNCAWTPIEIHGFWPMPQMRRCC